MTEQRFSEEMDRLHRQMMFHLRYSLCKTVENACVADIFSAVALAVRQQMIDGYLQTQNRYIQQDVKRLYYLSMEFLIGRSLRKNLINLDLLDPCERVLSEMGYELDAILDVERDAALGNGGLGRLAACFLDSMASMNMPGFGYGINYDYGLFRQDILDGYQVERPDYWSSETTPWLIERPEDIIMVPIYGKIEHARDREGGYNPMWLDWRLLVGLPHDMLITGHGGKTVNLLRLFSARASDEFDMRIFNAGDYLRAVKQKVASETVSKVLYPSDTVAGGKELRLIQEYFLVACALRDLFRRYQKQHQTIDAVADKIAIQLNDTHPALAVAEMMRLLVDEHGLPWEKAWTLTNRTLAYTNHTLMPEALEKWTVPLMARVLPRHLQIIFEINHRFLKEVSEIYPSDGHRLQRMSIIEESKPKRIRMAHLCIVGSHSINGVAELHTELVKKHLFPDFFDMWPRKFNNKTNGVTQRRWLLNANPGLSSLIVKTIGPGWITDLPQLKQLDRLADDAAFQDDIQGIKQQNKLHLTEFIKKTCHQTVNPHSLFDVQIKRIHEYKRQLLNVLHIIGQYLQIKEDGLRLSVPKTYIFAGKAAPGYTMAKLIIKLIHSVGQVVNSDTAVNEMMTVVFVPDYRVTLGEKIFPAADLSEQISTAGMEASGTGNMKFALNGALTIGTLDGANIEIQEAVGKENIFIFGLNADQIAYMRGRYDSWLYYRQYPKIRRVIDALVSGQFSPHDKSLFQPIYDGLLHKGDYYFHLADFQPYAQAHEAVAKTYTDPKLWNSKVIHNIARCGKFSSDRTVMEYARDIWNIDASQIAD